MRPAACASTTARFTLRRVAEDDAVQNWMEIFRAGPRGARGLKYQQPEDPPKCRGFSCRGAGHPIRTRRRMELPAVAIDFMNHADVSRALDQVNALQETTRCSGSLLAVPQSPRFFQRAER